MIKVITNMLAFIHLVAAGEALMLAKRGGVDLATAYEVIRASSGNIVRARDREPGDPQRLLRHRLHDGPRLKDLGFALELGREHRRAARARRARRGRRSCAHDEQYGGSAWSSQVVKLLEDALGVDLRAPGFPARPRRNAAGPGGVDSAQWHAG